VEEVQKPKRGLVIRLGKRVRGRFNRLIARSSLVPVTPYIDSSLFPWAATLESNWADIRAELDALSDNGAEILPLARVSPDHQRVAKDGKWKSLVLEAYGYYVPRNRGLCPRTSELLDQVPGLVLAMFSIMDPGTYVPLHKGVSKALLNGHLALDVPDGDCRIEVGGETRSWEEGKLLILDDTIPHQVWNNTNKRRVVLLMQVRRPVRPFAQVIGTAFLGAVRWTGYIQDPRRELGAVPNG
jgi:beta-hydroxylase